MKKLLITLIFTIILSLSAFAQDKVQVDNDQSYLVLSTKKISTMEKELDEVAAKGFRVLYGAPTQQYDMSILLKRIENPDSEPYTYKVLATSRLKTMEKELNDLAQQGFQLLPRTIIFKQGFITAELVMLMERAPKSNKTYEYKLVQGRKETKVHKEIDAAAKEAFYPITMIVLGETVVVLEREIRNSFKAN
ncbi:MAG TPA: hypothetical protein PKE69_12570 [Pyrinomonadaceae bacterium]|nr:hypothetical protein [Pyrinomonadaceae bacterium]